MSDLLLGLSMAKPDEDLVNYNCEPDDMKGNEDVYGELDVDQVQTAVEGEMTIVDDSTLSGLHSPQDRLHHPSLPNFNRFKMQNVLRYLAMTAGISVKAEAKLNLYGDGLVLLFGEAHPLLCEMPVEPVVSRKTREPARADDGVKWLKFKDMVVQDQDGQDYIFCTP